MTPHGKHGFRCDDNIKRNLKENKRYGLDSSGSE
jgi:hypothetical protein